jgi:hypothetical protein
MENLIMNGTNISPEILFYADGSLKMKGKIITENAVLTFEPIFNWLNGFTGDRIEFDIILEYMNTSASMQLYSLLTKLDQNPDIKSIRVNWFFEEDDEEHLETGELFEDRLERADFNYIMITENRGVA